MQGYLKAVGSVLPGELIITQLPAIGCAQVGLGKQGKDVVTGHLGLAVFSQSLHRRAEIDLQPARQLQPMIAPEHVRHAALTRLAVNTDHFLIRAAYIRWIDWQIRHVPRGTVIAFGQTLVNRILMAA